jgi:hypothetical protein
VRVTKSDGYVKFGTLEAIEKDGERQVLRILKDDGGVVYVALGTERSVEEVVE